jgi:DNA-binding NtrC family response regulator
MAAILLVEDEDLLRWSLQQRLEREGHTVDPAPNLATAEAVLNAVQPDVVLLDLSLPDGHGLEFFERHRERLEDSVVVVMTAVGQIEHAVRAMKLGALDFLSKPVDHASLVALIDRSLDVRSTRRDAQVARRQRESALESEIISHSRSFRRTLEIAQEVARSAIDTVLLLGESGTGKNVVSRFIHAASDRNEAPLIEVNCAAIPEQLLESELFGHERGAFTDAKSTRRGTFELAEGGTVLLDEIGEIRLDTQAKLLHLLEERAFRRVGGSREIRVDVRVVAATNRDIRDMVERRDFRDDLYYRLSTFPIEIPPLRNRHEDILPLARHFLRRLQGKVGRSYGGFSREAENILLAYPWPGNVRELRNVVERAVILEKGDLITPHAVILDSVAAAPARDGTGAPTTAQGIVPLEKMERELVSRAMAATGGNQTRAAELLGVTRDQLRYRLKKFDL